MAVKEVKLPPAASDLEVFQSRVSCVLKDMEVMQYPLANHSNILDLLGHGWQLQGGSIPFNCHGMGETSDVTTIHKGYASQYLPKVQVAYFRNISW